MKLQEKKLKHFKTYKGIANALFVIVLVFGILGFLTMVSLETLLVVKGFDISEMLRNVAEQHITGVDINIAEIPHTLIFVLIFNMGLGIALTAYLIKSVANLFKSIVETQTPFHERTIRILRAMGIAFFIYTALLFLTSIATIAISTSAMGADKFNIVGTIKYSTLLYGFLMLALAEIFEFGSGLQQDSESIV